MKTLTLAVTLLLVAKLASAGIVFEERFDGAADWASTESSVANAITPGSLPRPAGFDGYREGMSFWAGAPKHHIISSGVSAQGGAGKGLTVNTESAYGWAGGGFFKYLGWPGHQRLLVRFSMKIPSNLCWQVNPSPHAMNGKLLRVTATRRPFEVIGYDGLARYPAADTAPTSICNWYARPMPTYPAPAIVMQEPRLAPGYTSVAGNCGGGFCYGNAFFPNDGEPGAVTTTPATAPVVNGNGQCGDGQWHTYEYDHWLNSALGVADGGYRIYKDGVLWVSKTDIPWVSAGVDANGTVMTLDSGWNLIWIPDNHEFFTYERTSQVSMPFYLDNIVAYTPLTATDPLWATSPQDGRLPLNYTISGEPLPADTSVPIVTGFALPATYSSLTVPVTTFAASDDSTVTGYAVTTSATPPATGWSATPPSTVTAVEGSNTFYAWARDAAGNVSAAATATVTVTLTPSPTPSTPRLRGNLRGAVR